MDISLRIAWLEELRECYVPFLLITKCTPVWIKIATKKGTLLLQNGSVLLSLLYRIWEFHSLIQSFMVLNVTVLVVKLAIAHCFLNPTPLVCPTLWSRRCTFSLSVTRTPPPLPTPNMFPQESYFSSWPLSRPVGIACCCSWPLWFMAVMDLLIEHIRRIKSLLHTGHVSLLLGLYPWQYIEHPLEWGLGRVRGWHRTDSWHLYNR